MQANLMVRKDTKKHIKIHVKGVMQINKTVWSHREVLQHLFKIDNQHVNITL